MSYRFCWIALILFTFEESRSQGAEKNVQDATPPIAANATRLEFRNFTNDFDSLFKGNDDQSTVGILEKGAKKDVQNPQNFREFFIQGCHYLDKRDFDKAIEDFNEVIKLDPDQGLAYYARGVAFFEKGEFGKVIADLTKSHELLPATFLENKKELHNSLHSLRGRAYFENGEADAALYDLNRALEIDPKDDETYLHRSVAFENKGEPEKALSDLDNAIRLNPANIRAYGTRGDIYVQSGEVKKGIDSFSQGIRLKPDDFDLHYARGLSYSKINDWEKAIQDFSVAIKSNSTNAWAFMDRGYANYELGNFDSAINDYTEAIRIDPKAGNFYHWRAAAFEMKRLWKKAVADYLVTVRLNPEDADAFNDLSWLLGTCPDASIRDGRKAVEMAKKACELAKWKEWSFIGTLAAAYAEAGDFEQAVKFQRQCLSMEGISDADRAEEEGRLKFFQERKPYREK